MSLSQIGSYQAASVAGAPAAASQGSRTPNPAPVGDASPAAPAAPVAKPAAVASVAEVAPSAADKARLDKAVDSINRFIKPVNSSVEFSVDEKSGRTVVQVIDTDTKDVLRQFPSKEALAISQELDRYQGLLVKDKA